MKTKTIIPLLTTIASALALSLYLTVSAPADKEKDQGAADDPGKALKCLLVTGGCCHDYAFQSKALTLSSSAKADIDWTVVNKGGRGTKAQIDLYDDPKWAEQFDVVVHNECFIVNCAVIHKLWLCFGIVRKLIVFNDRFSPCCPGCG